ncbi:MAG TPA: TadE family protein [Acidobacteriota bacterium]|nr:TadE family protein [Acidobacteriota bacterium]
MRMELRSGSGQTIVEFALIAVILFAVIFSIIESAFIMYNKALITTASREAARAGVMHRVNPSDFAYAPLNAAGIRAVAVQNLQNRLVTFGTPFNPANDVIVGWSLDGGNTWSANPPAAFGGREQIRVDVNFTYTYLALPRLINLGGGTMSLGTRTIMRME